MEEEKAAAYYDELTRKGGGAARFKQGLGFSSSYGDGGSTADPPSRGSGLVSSSSSFFSQFVKASDSSGAKPEEDKARQKPQLESVQNKLRKKDPSSIESRSKGRVREKDRERHSRRTESPSRERRRRRSRPRSCSDEDRERRRERRRRRSRSRSFSDEESERRRGRRRRSRSRSVSPSHRRSERRREGGDRGRPAKKEHSNPIDYGKLIKGYDEMTPAERVKAKMKLQLAETAARDTKIGTGSGWERFDFDKDAPLDDGTEEIEGADDDARVVKRIGQTFRFSNIQAKREEEIRAAHDEAIFGAPVRALSVSPENVHEAEEEKGKEQAESESNDPTPSLFGEKIPSRRGEEWGRAKALERISQPIADTVDACSSTRG